LKWLLKSGIERQTRIVASSCVGGAVRETWQDC
jgi:hypothetical protein